MHFIIGKIRKNLIFNKHISKYCISPAMDSNNFLRAPKAVTPISRRSLSVNVLKVVQSISCDLNKSREIPFLIIQ